ncbi:MAG: nucleotide pyrophosphohydrolase [Planctomycetes bacterium]|nr:nucleotide pyrophosphohydrolase [Planctomycetota bacterium]
MPDAVTTDAVTTVGALKEAVWRFADERSWHRFHSPKNLVMGLAVETAELMEHFLWVECEASRALVDDPAQRAEIADELADVACHLLNLSNSLNIDLSDAVAAKLVKNAQKYPAEKYRGKYEA